MLWGMGNYDWRLKDLEMVKAQGTTHNWQEWTDFSDFGCCALVLVKLMKDVICVAQHSVHTLPGGQLLLCCLRICTQYNVSTLSPTTGTTNHISALNIWWKWNNGGFVVQIIQRLTLYIGKWVSGVCFRRAKRKETQSWPNLIITDVN